MKFPKFEDCILFENEDLMVLNKPPFLSSLDDRDGTNVNLLRLAKRYSADAQICHRLDKETSGALVIAKNPATYRFISMQFEHRKVKKVYHTIVNGIPIFKNLEVDLPILNVGNKNVAISKQHGKIARTTFNTIRYFKHHALVECMPITGRMHQIRIHLASQRACIAGDKLYGGEAVFLSQIKKGYRSSKDHDELPIMKRFALHARQISFHIDENTGMSFEAPYPKDFEILLKLLQKFDSTGQVPL